MKGRYKQLPHTTHTQYTHIHIHACTQIITLLFICNFTVDKK